MKMRILIKTEIQIYSGLIKRIRDSLFLLAIVPSFLNAQLLTDEEEQAASRSSDEAQTQKSYSFTLSSTGITSFHDVRDEDRRQGLDLNITGLYFLNGLTFISSLSGYQDMQGEREFFVGDATLGVHRNFSNIGKIRTSASLTAIIPLSENNKDLRGMNTGGVLAPIFTLPMGDFGIENLSLSYRPSFAYYSHAYDVSLHGSSNTKMSLGNRLRATYTLNNRYQFGVTTSYSRSYTYAGNSRDSFGFVSSFGAMLSQQTSFELGISTQGNPLRPNGVDNELVFFDSRESLAYFALAIRI